MATARSSRQRSLRSAKSSSMERNKNVNSQTTYKQRHTNTRKKSSRTKRSSSSSTKSRTRQSIVQGSYDYTLLFLTIFLSCLGLVMIYSSSCYIAETKYGGADYFVKRQGIAVILGTAVMLFVSKFFDYRIFKKFLPFRGLDLTALVPIKGWTLSGICYLFAIALQTYTLFFGVETNGARRWISLGPLGTFQPAEFTKVAVILLVANMIFLAPKRLEKFWGFLGIILCIAPVIFLVLKENLSSALVITGIAFVMCFVSSKKIWYFFLCGGAAAAGAWVFIMSGWRSSRVEIWRNVETSTLDGAFQMKQGLYAIASGGFFGTGLGESMQKFFVPEAYNDMIFTVICEELGLVGASAIILLFFLVIYRIFNIAMHTKDLFGAMICTGVIAHIAIQVIMNVLVVTNTIPSTGIPMPFISYGGSSVIILLVEIGIVLNISKNVGPSQMEELERSHR